jgi:hypothetical protein
VPITEALGALGSWSLTLREDTPRKIRDALTYFGHITVHTGRVNPALIGDGLLRSSRYTGVLRGIGEHDDQGLPISGAGMAFWLGDEDDKGSVIETPVVLTAQTFTQSVRTLLPASGAVTEGILSPIAGTFTNTFQYIVPRKAIDYVCTTMGGEWRVNGDATLDAGSIADLYVTDPKCLVVKRGAGVDMARRALLGAAAIDTDVEDFTTRALLLAASTDTTVATGAADIAPGLNPYKDLHGNPVALTRMISESTTDPTNADARAQLQLNRFTGRRDALALSTTEYDIDGSVRVGDYVGVYNPDIKLEDPTNEVVFRGARINPVNLRLIETTWPVSRGFTVAFRDTNGVWLDLTDYVLWEAGQTTLKVGGYSRSLLGTGTEPIGRLPVPDASVPAVTVWTAPFQLGVYQSAVTGEARGEVILTWDRPDNTDSSPIVDGSHYEIRYRRATTPLYPITWDTFEPLGNDWDDIEATGATWNSGIVIYPETEWQTAYAPFDVTVFRLQELVPAMPYEAQIRAVDLATPANMGTWSALTAWQTTSDDIAPETPAPPTIAANPLAVQMVHTLGIAAGGTFNLDRDLHHLELHGGVEPLFTPTDATLLGKVIANWGMITGNIPVVQTFPQKTITAVYYKVIAVDLAGNKSYPSASVVMTVGLIDDQYISNLTVSKLTAGTMSASVVLAGSIKTAFSGARTEQDVAGIRLYNASGIKTVDLSTLTGQGMFTGTMQSGTGDQRIVINPTPEDRARIDIYDDGSTDHVTQVMIGGIYINQRERNSDRASNGGRVYWDTSNAYYGYVNPSADAHIRFSSNNGIAFQGAFAKTVTNGGAGALYVDQVGGSGTFASITYGATMSSVPLPFCDIQATSGSPVGKYHCIGSRSATGFGIEYPSGNYDIFIWAARIV